VDLVGPCVSPALDGSERTFDGGREAGDDAETAPPSPKRLRTETSEPAVKVRFFKGMYHDVLAKGVLSEASLVFAPNAGLAAFPSWVPTLEALARTGAPPAVFTDFTEEAALLAADVLRASAGRGKPADPRVVLNPFRQNMAITNTDHKLPTFFNGWLVSHPSVPLFAEEE